MNDLTILFITANEVPKNWVKFHLTHLLKATQNYPIISISRKPMDLGINLIDTDKKDYANIYRQMLKGAKLALTDYVAMVEDDTLYSKEHFNCFRPKPDEFAYNRSRWSLFTWLPIYSLRQRISNCSLIAPRLLLIEALKERFAKNISLNLMGECGRNNLEQQMGITQRKAVDFFSEVPIIQLSHPSGTENRQQSQRKKHAQIKAIEIPYWGLAQNIVNQYDDNNLLH